MVVCPSHRLFGSVLTHGRPLFQEELFSCFLLLAGSFSPIIARKLKLPSAGRGIPGVMNSQKVSKLVIARNGVTKQSDHVEYLQIMRLLHFVRNDIFFDF
jgi:hypothetical protein